MATQMLRHKVPYEEALRDILDLYDVLDKEESLEVYEKEYQNGAGFVTGWRSWGARLYPTTQSCVRCRTRYRAWPARFSSLVSRAVHSARNSTWWWWEGSMFDGELKETDVEGVFALEESSYILP